MRLFRLLSRPHNSLNALCHASACPPLNSISFSAYMRALFISLSGGYAFPRSSHDKSVNNTVPSSLFFTFHSGQRKKHQCAAQLAFVKNIIGVAAVARKRLRGQPNSAYYYYTVKFLTNVQIDCLNAILT
jgi:hypothetical protein